MSTWCSASRFLRNSRCMHTQSTLSDQEQQALHMDKLSCQVLTINEIGIESAVDLLSRERGRGSHDRGRQGAMSHFGLLGAFRRSSSNSSGGTCVPLGRQYRAAASPLMAGRRAISALPILGRTVADVSSSALAAGLRPRAAGLRPGKHVAMRSGREGQSQPHPMERISSTGDLL